MFNFFLFFELYVKFLYWSYACYMFSMFVCFLGLLLALCMNSTGIFGRRESGPLFMQYRYMLLVLC